MQQPGVVVVHVLLAALSLIFFSGTARAAEPDERDLKAAQPKAERMQQLRKIFIEDAPPPPPPPAPDAPTPDDPAAGVAASSAAPTVGALADYPECRHADAASSPAEKARLEQEIQACRLARRPTTVVVSGGVSLGSHQGGVLHYLSQLVSAYSRYTRKTMGLEKTPGLAAELNLATGASAGSINAFIAAMTACREPVSQPDQSLFYRTWIPVGMEGLMNAKDVTPKSVLSRAPIDGAICRIRRMWEPDYIAGCSADDLARPMAGGWSKQGCRGNLAFNVTRIQARNIPIIQPLESNALTAKRQTEQFLLEYIMAPGDAAPRFRPMRPVLKPGDSSAVPEIVESLYPILGTGKTGQDIALDHVFQLLKASSSFPVAFEPVPVPHRLVFADSAGRPTAGPVDDQSLFLDGGVFDNTPLGVAITMNRWLDRKPFYVFVEPDAIGWHKAAPKRRTQAAADETLMGIYGDFMGDFITVSRQAEILNAVALNPELQTYLQIPPRQLPTASGRILNFLGFFETNFRRFDFYLGMADAFSYLRSSAKQVDKANADYNRQFGVLEEAGLLPAVSDPMFTCMRALREKEPPVFAGRLLPDPGTEDACQGVRDKEPNLMALYRTTRDLRAYTETAGWDADAEENKFFKLLKKHKFKFRDLKHDGDLATPKNAQEAVRDKLQTLVHMLGAKQPGFLASGALSVAGKGAANIVKYRAPTHAIEIGTTLNGAGLGASYLLSSRKGWRAELGGIIYPWSRMQLREGESSTWAGTWSSQLLLGKEWAPSSRWQFSIGAGWDLRLATTVRDFFPYLVPDDRLFWRHGPMVRLRATLYQRLTIGVDTFVWLDDCSGNNTCKQVVPAARTYNEALVTNRAMARFFLGFRFLDLWTP